MWSTGLNVFYVKNKLWICNYIIILFWVKVDQNIIL